jgi:hypothetical protein
MARRRCHVQRHVQHEAWEMLFKLLLVPITLPLWLLRRLF